MIKRDLVIVGGGPAGMAAAISAHENGIKDILLIERDQYLGGISWRKRGISFREREYVLTMDMSEARNWPSWEVFVEFLWREYTWLLVGDSG